MDQTELLAVQVQLERLVLQDKTVILVQSVQPDFRDLPVIQAHLELQDQLDQLAILDRKVRKVRMGLLDPLEQQEIPEMQALPAPMGSRERMAHLERREVLEQLGVLVPRDLLERLVSPEHREIREHQVPLDL